MLFLANFVIMISIDPKSIPIPELHAHLLGAIGPRPIAFASTVDEKGNHNLAPFSFFNVFSANPPILIFSPARSGRNNTTKDTFENAKKIPECVINVVTYDMVHQMSLTSSPYASNVDEFLKAGFIPLPSETVRPLRVQESPIHFECKIIEIKELGNQGGAGNLIVCEVTRMHIHEDLMINGRIDQTKIDLVARMGGNWYCRAHGSSLFEVQKPLTTLGIGFDNLPKDILNSSVLSGNDLGQLANVEQIPDETDVNDYKLIELSDLFIALEDDAKKLENELHHRAKQLLVEHRVIDAWLTLLSFNN
jgi:flavin reductase (DIM6/NTAB) family NADH-FMN oxidoreductase RutF